MKTHLKKLSAILMTLTTLPLRVLAGEQTIGGQNFESSGDGILPISFGYFLLGFLVISTIGIYIRRNR